LPGYHVELWHGLWMPKGTPNPIIEKLNAAVVDALANSVVRPKLSELGQEIYPPTGRRPRLSLHCKAPRSGNAIRSSRLRISGWNRPPHVLDGEIAERHGRCERKASLVSGAAFVTHRDDAARIEPGNRPLPLMHHLTVAIGKQAR
jgi:hypothetical protein